VSRSVAVLGAATVLGASVVFLGSIAALVTLTVLSLLALPLLVSWLVDPIGPDARTRVLRWTIAGFFAHLVFGLAVFNLSGVFSALRSDALTYHGLAQAITNSWTSDSPGPHLPAGKEGYYYLLAAIYRVFGPHPAAGLVVNAALASALVPILTDLTRRLFGPHAARYAGPLIVLMPGVFIWTSQLLKEAAILFLVAVTASAAVRLSNKVTVAPLLAAAGGLALLFTFRGPVALVMGGGVVAGLVLSKRELFAGLSTALSTLALIALTVVSLGVGYSGFQNATSSDLGQAHIVRQDLARSANTGFDHEVDISTTRGAFSYLPVGLFNFVLGPFPWQIQGVGQLAMGPDVLVWWFLLPSLWRGLTTGFRTKGRAALVLVLPALISTVMLALVIGNFGTVVRERAQVVVLLVPFIALGLALRAARSGPARQEQPPAVLVAR
jgi:4-amino-4-deoxy-L-arabinose transferase-like glycosyltransferase